MLTLICGAPGELEYREAEYPEIINGFSIIKIRRVGVCGTDLHAFEGTQPYFSYPRILGHELAAEFVEGDAAGCVPGDLVTIMPYLHCGNCIACKKGFTNCCTSMQVCGVHIDGGMVEYLSVPSYTIINGGGLTPDQLALTEPLAIAAHGIRRAGVVAGEWVVITGAGPIGLALVEFAILREAKVIVLDVNETRLNFCRLNWSGVFTVNPATEQANERIRDLTSGEMASVVIDASGNLAAINKAFMYMAHTGRYILVGLQRNDISFSHPEFHKREATLMSSRNATREDFDLVLHHVKAGEINTNKYITHHTAFYQVKNNFQQWLNPESGVIKVLIDMP
ncbi:MAG TPA: zinc-binding alcohol dehydrogenase family protein [Chitinophagaceae bacterium]|nr:zinc-binding alcohol dehydrogenase family protein [Chitinophagaceae bacterium]